MIVSVLNFFFKGALTNKPSAFNFRAWELEIQKSFNFFDVFCEDLLVELRGLSVVRVLPNVKDLLAFNWITDKTRFFIDSLQYQRTSDILLTLQKNKKQSVVRLEWRYLVSFFNFWFAKVRTSRQLCLLFMKQKVAKYPFSYNFLFNVNFNTDVLDLSSFVQSLKRVGGGFLLSEFKGCVAAVKDNFLKFDVVSLQSFFMSFSVQSLLLVDIDIRFDYPKLNLLLKNLKKKFNSKIFSCGVRLLGVQDLRVINLGLSLSVFLNVLRGSDLFNNILSRGVFVRSGATSNLCIIGDGFFNRVIAGGLENLFYSFCSRFNFKLFRLKPKVSALNSSLFNVRNMRLFFRNYFSLSNVKETSGFFFDSSDGLSFVNKHKFSFLYCQMNPFLQGTGLGCFLQVPCSSIYERAFLHMNVFGKLKESFKYVRGVGSVESGTIVEQRPLFKFFQVLSDFSRLAGRRVQSFSNFLMFLMMKPTLNVLSSSVIVMSLAVVVARFKVVKDFLLYSFVFNFYKNDEFSRNSLVLSVTARIFMFANYLQ